MGSPALLLMNRRLRTDLPTQHKELLPKLTDLKATRKALEQRKLEQKRYYDRSAKELLFYTRMIQSEYAIKGSGNQRL